MESYEKTLLEVNIEHRGEINLVGKRLRTTFENGQQAQDIPPFFHKTVINGDMKRVSGRKNSNQYCIVQLKPGSQEFDYIISVEAEEGGIIPDDMIQLSLPAQDYAALTFIKRGNPDVMAAYQYISEFWLPHSPYQPADGPGFIFYQESFFTVYEKYGYAGNPVASAYFAVEKV